MDQGWPPNLDPWIKVGPPNPDPWIKAGRPIAWSAYYLFLLPIAYFLLPTYCYCLSITYCSIAYYLFLLPIS